EKIAPRRLGPAHSVTAEWVVAIRLARVRRIDVARPEQMKTTAKVVCNGSGRRFPQLSLDAHLSVEDVRHSETRIERLNTRALRRRMQVIEAWLEQLEGVGRIGDDYALLSQAVVAQRICINAGAQMIEEETGAAANHRLAASRRLPGEPYARREIELVAEMRLKFVAYAEREREVAVHAKIVLRKPGGFILAETQRRIAAIDGELRR